MSAGGEIIDSYLNGCVFCDSRHETFGNTPEFKRITEGKIPNRKLFETENFVVFPTVGQIVEGYLLIMPKSHTTSIANMNKQLFDELEYVYSQTSNILESNYSKPIFFEHGVCRTAYDNYNGCCVDHAHIHAVPAQVNVSNELKKEFKFTKIKKVSELAKIGKNGNYLYVDDISGDKLVFEANSVRSQHIRYLIAEELNVPEKGDWYIYPGEQEINATIRKLSKEKMKKFEETMLVVGKDER